MQCPKCGYGNPDGYLYCSLCHEVFKTRSEPRGDSLEEVRYSMMHKHREKMNWKRWIAFDVWISLIIIIAVSIWVYSKLKKPEEVSQIKRTVETRASGEISSHRLSPPEGAAYRITTHFEIYSKNEVLADDIASRIEEYSIIPIDLGLAEGNFWERGKVYIYIYETPQEFRKATGAADWSSGYSNFKARVIYSYEDVEHLIEAVFPHELTHLIFADFMGQKQNYPKWLTEGLATYEEAKYCKAYATNYQTILNTLRQGKYLGVEKLSQKDISKEKNLEAVQAWYVEALSLTTYLLEVYGRGSFYTFCKTLKEGIELEEALTKVYAPNFNSLPELTGRWLNHIKNNEQNW